PLAGPRRPGGPHRPAGLELGVGVQPLAVALLGVGLDPDDLAAGVGHVRAERSREGIVLRRLVAVGGEALGLGDRHRLGGDEDRAGDDVGRLGGEGGGGKRKQDGGNSTFHGSSFYRKSAIGGGVRSSPISRGDRWKLVLERRKLMRPVGSFFGTPQAYLAR